MRETNVFGDTQIRTKQKFLMHDRHARPLGIERGMKPPFDTFHHYAPFARLVNAGENFSQRAFACTVLTHDGVATSSGHVKADILQRNRARKALADATKTDGGNGSFGTQRNKLRQAKLRIRRWRQNRRRGRHLK